MSIAWKTRALLLAASLAAPPSGAFAEEDIAQFYRQQVVRVGVGFPAGGVNDILARHIARLLPTHMPGSPRVVVQNMPGAGSMKAVEWLALHAPRDGTAFGAISTTVIMQSILGSGDDLVARLEWLGSAESVTRICFALKESGISDLDVVRTRGVIVGATGAGSPTSDHARLFRRALGDKVRIVSGYAGAAELSLAMERKEIEAICGNSIQTIKIDRPDWYAQRRLNFLIRFSDEPRGEAAGLPSFIALLPEADRDAATYLLRQDAFARAFAMPPDVPPARLEAFRAAFDATLDASEFRAVMASAGAEHAPLRGADMAHMIASMREAAPDLKNRARGLLAEP